MGKKQFLSRRFERNKNTIPIHGNFSPTSTHLHPLQGENCDSNSRLVVDEDDNSKFKLERVKHQEWQMCILKLNKYVSLLSF